MKKRTNFYLDDDDRRDIETIREYYHLNSDTAAVRFTLHKMAEEVRRLISKGKTKPKDEQNA